MDHTKPLSRYLVSVAGYGGYFVSNIFFLIFVMPLYFLLFFAPPVQKRFITALFHRYLAFLTRYYLPGIGVYRIVEISGFDTARAACPAVFIANHRSRIDALFLLGKLRDTAALIKTRYARLPVFSSFVKHLDFIDINPRSLGSLGKALEKAKQVIEKGKNIVVFPEGTRSKTGRLREFKDIPFKIAIESHVPVIPVIIHSTLPFMAKRQGSIVPSHRFDFTIRCCAPVYPRRDETPGELNTRCRTVMAGHVKELDKGTVWQTRKDMQ
ncbi:MAG: hypothetical protein GF350_01920 [Chitinivibrionales bacterium]|nr:hypothetical protein [Chitinivibrionales bacterium]